MGMMVMPSVEVELLLLLFFFALPLMLVHHVQLGFLCRHRFAPCCSFAYNHPVLHVGKMPDHSKVSVFSPKEHPPCSWGLTAEQCLGCLLLVEAWLVSQLAFGHANRPCSIVESETLVSSMLVQGVHFAFRKGIDPVLCITCFEHTLELGGLNELQLVARQTGVLVD